jgi:hypothetical protein
MSPEKFEKLLIPDQDECYNEYKVIRENYEREIHEELDAAENVCLSVYVWKRVDEPAFMRARDTFVEDPAWYALVVAHFFDSEWTRKSRFLQTELLGCDEEKEALESVGHAVKEVVNKWNLKDKVYIFDFYIFNYSGGHLTFF